MAQVTLLHAPQAKAGNHYVYRGPMPECQECRVKGACLNQEVGRRYRVTAVRSVRHPCPLTADLVAAIEAEPAAPPMSWWSRAAIAGSSLTYEPLDCDRHDCVNFATCHPQGIARGDRVRIVEFGARLTCPLGYEIVPCAVDYDTK